MLRLFCLTTTMLAMTARLRAGALVDADDVAEMCDPGDASAVLTLVPCFPL